MEKGTVKDKMNPQEFREYLAKKERAKNSKFGAIPTQTSDGQKFKSLLEAGYYQSLWVQQNAGIIQKIEREVRYELVVNGHLVGVYYLDFRVTYSDGKIEYVDCKSQPTVTPLYKIKRNLMLALYGIEIKEVYK